MGQEFQTTVTRVEGSRREGNILIAVHPCHTLYYACCFDYTQTIQAEIELKLLDHDSMVI
jgi:hypothetical protein